MNRILTLEECLCRIIHGGVCVIIHLNNLSCSW